MKEPTTPTLDVEARSAALNQRPSTSRDLYHRGTFHPGAERIWAEKVSTALFHACLPRPIIANDRLGGFLHRGICAGGELATAPARDAGEWGAYPLPSGAPPGKCAAVLQGIITHFVDPELRPKLKESSDSLRLIEDLGLDSLTMIEIMLRVEDLLNIRVSDEDLRHFRTLGEVRGLIDRTLAAAAPGPLLPGSGHL